MKKNDFLVLKRSDAVLKIHNWDFTFADYMTMCMINSVVFFFSLPIQNTGFKNLMF